MRKLHTDEVGGVKMEKNEKRSVLQFEKTYFLHCCSVGFAFQR
jgi:hypothetical protein